MQSPRSTYLYNELISGCGNKLNIPESSQLMHSLKVAVHTLKPDCFWVNLLTSTLVQALRKENHMLLLLMEANQMLRKVSQSEHQ